MSVQRKSGTRDTDPGDSNSAVLAELRLMNRLLAALLTRTMPQGDAIKVLAGVGYGPTEIAVTLSMNPVTVRSKLFRARKASQTTQSKAPAEKSATGDAALEDQTELRISAEDISADA